MRPAEASDPTLRDPFWLRRRGAQQTKEKNQSALRGFPTLYLVSWFSEGEIEQALVFHFRETVWDGGGRLGYP